MPVYNYEALKNGTEVVQGKIEASSVKEARELVRKIDLVPTKIYDQEKGKDKPKKTVVKKNNLKKLKMREKIDFTNTLKILTQTGVPIIEALLFIETNSASKRVQTMSGELRKQIIGGSTLADTVSRYPHIFDQVFAGLIRAGEESGELDVTLGRMSELLDKQDRLKSKVIGTLTYPAFVVVLAIGVVLVMLMFVFPAFKDMYDNMGAELPWITQMCMNTGTFLKTYWVTIPIGFASAFYGIYYLFKWEKSKRAIDEFVLKIPIFHHFVKLSTLSNFISVMHVAYEAGVPIVDCLYLSNLTINNFILRDAIKKAAFRVQHGTQLSTALVSTNLMPKILLFMVSTGEQSGKLGEMLKQAGDYIDVELERVIDNLTKLIEPAMLVVIGAIVLVLALALYLPLFQSYANIS